ncbi:MAG TPA: cohesin domain-containing protein [Labilithrix sp.]
MKRALVLFMCALLACGKADGSATDTAPPAAFVSDDHGDGAAVFLRGRPEGDKLLVDVVARGAPDLHGAALRVKFDPSALKFLSADASGVWSKSALSASKEGTPGQLAIAWVEKGEVGIAAKTDSTLGTIAFERKTSAATSLEFKTQRSGLVDHLGAPVTVAWHGGTVAAR